VNSWNSQGRIRDFQRGVNGFGLFHAFAPAAKYRQLIPADAPDATIKSWLARHDTLT
jgi:hypothetical protein